MSLQFHRETTIAVISESLYWNILKAIDKNNGYYVVLIISCFISYFSVNYILMHSCTNYSIRILYYCIIETKQLGDIIFYPLKKYRVLGYVTCTSKLVLIGVFNIIVIRSSLAKSYS